MKNKRRNHSAQFKAQVALAAAKGDKFAIFHHFPIFLWKLLKKRYARFSVIVMRR